jgi:hypothetical protein
VTELAGPGSSRRRAGLGLWLAGRQGPSIATTKRPLRTAPGVSGSARALPPDLARHAPTADGVVAERSNRCVVQAQRRTTTANLHWQGAVFLDGKEHQ